MISNYCAYYGIIVRRSDNIGMYLPVYGPTSSIGCLIVRRLLGDDMIFLFA